MIEVHACNSDNVECSRISGEANRHRGPTFTPPYVGVQYALRSSLDSGSLQVVLRYCSNFPPQLELHTTSSAWVKIVNLMLIDGLKTLWLFLDHTQCRWEAGI